MAKEYSQFSGEGMKYAPKPKAKRRTGSSGTGTPKQMASGNKIRDANMVRQDMKAHRRAVTRMGQ